MVWPKRIISWFLTFIMISGTCALSMTAQAKEETEVAAGEQSAAKAEDTAIAEKLTKLGVIDEFDTQTLTNTIKRFEIIPLLMELAGLNNGAETSAVTSPFLDISAFDKQIGAYSTLYKQGYITGDENRMFRPNDLLTYNEAVTLVINIMGYKLFAMRNGGYPSGYLYTANVCKLLDGLTGQGSDPIVWYDVCRILNHAMDADAVVVTNYTGDGEAEFTLDKERTILEDRYSITKTAGIVTGNENTRLRSSDSTGIGQYQIEIDRTVYNTPDAEYAQFLGKAVYAYLKKNEQGEFDVLYLEEIPKKNTEYRLDAADILFSETTGSKIYYTDKNDSKKHISLDAANLVVIYNGKSHTGYGALSDILPKNGYLTALDNTGDQISDVLFINEFQNFIIDSYDSYTNTYYEKYTKEPLRLDPAEDDLRIYNADGSAATIDKLVRGTFISFMQTENSKGYRLITVTINSKSVAGQLDEIFEGDKYLINGTYYELANNMKQYISQGLVAAPKVGQTAAFYLDLAGRIGYYDRDAAQIKGQYAVVMGTEVTGAIADSISLKLFTDEGKIIDVKTTKNLNMDGKRYTLSNKSEIEKVLPLIPVGDIIIFSMNGENVNYIDTPAPNSVAENPLGDAGNLNLIASGSEFRARNGMCHGTDPSQNKFVVKSNETVIFSTPSMDKLLEDTDEYAVTKKLNTSKLLYGQYQNTATRQNIEYFAAYNLEDTKVGISTCLLLRGAGGTGASGLSRSSRFHVFTKFTDSLDADGVHMKRAYYYENGEEGSCLVHDEVRYSYTRAGNAAGDLVPLNNVELCPGDVFQFSTDSNGYINAINVVYRADQSDIKSSYQPDIAKKELAWLTFPSYSMEFNINDGEGAAVGRFIDIDIKNSIMLFDMEDSEKSYQIAVDKASFELFRTDSLKGEPATSASLMEGDVVLIRSETGYDASAAQILILR